MLDKLGGIWAPRPSTGPHKLRECIPLIIILSKKLKYSTTRRESMIIVKGRCIKVNNKVRTDFRFPLGIMDVLSIEKTNEHFRIFYDVKGRFVLHKIDQNEAKYQLCRVKRFSKGKSSTITKSIFKTHKASAVPYIVTHDGRTIRYPDPDINENDTIKLNLEKNEIESFLKFCVGCLAVITGGNNVGRIGVVSKIEKHLNTFNIVHLVDKKGKVFATRLANVFVIGEGDSPAISLPKMRGIRLSNIQERKLRTKHSSDLSTI
jgi:small subunit ribosomal protein S4e